MTNRNRNFRRVVRNPIRRAFVDGAGSTGTLFTNMVDVTPQAELGSTADSRSGDLLVMGMALIDVADEAGIHQIVVWVGRSSTEPSPEDTGVRTRQVPANSAGLPFAVRFRGLRVDPGMIMKLITQPIAETVGTVVHQSLVSVKWSFRELRQG